MRHNSGFEPEPPPIHSKETELNNYSEQIQHFAGRMSYEQVIDGLFIIETIRSLINKLGYFYKNIHSIALYLAKFSYTARKLC